ncbi:uncharacterized protein [Macrobrachium rosenbergii]|uniref:uncharacterized protein n=1 Tax=Macrobrachium rosenbergii TaxID=79674 RepID=UPI0034D62EAF
MDVEEMEGNISVSGNKVKIVGDNQSQGENSKFKNKWLHACHRADHINTTHAVICSAHFNDDDYEDDLKARLLNTCRKTLKCNAVPSKALYKGSIPTSSTREDRARGRSRKRNVEEMLYAHTDETSVPGENGYSEDEEYHVKNYKTK